MRWWGWLLVYLAGAVPLTVLALRALSVSHTTAHWAQPPAPREER